jgi:hypothetical protein
MGRVAGAVEQFDARVMSQPAFDDPAGVRADAIEHDRDHRRLGVGVEDLLQELDTRAPGTPSRESKDASVKGVAPL